jgi:adenylate kinase family enzyme
VIARVLVCGCSGSGKSTLASRLAARLGLPLISLDAHYWLPGWKPGGDALLRARVAPLLAGERWVVDGNYFNALGDLHLARATHVVFFDLPRWLCILSVLCRVIGTYGRIRPEMAPGCPERFDWVFLRYVWTYRDRQRPKLLARFAAMREDQVLLRFTRRSAAAAWLAGLDAAGSA